ncbi:MAG: hypothetical protein HYV68_03680 [Candidatus Taylorbacteria bacterium]|nr:hypothetical protein [Candidatus Taylorbacteria bacterium]
MKAKLNTLVVFLTLAGGCATASLDSANSGRTFEIQNATPYSMDVLSNDELVAKLKPGEQCRVNQKWYDSTPKAFFGVAHDGDSNIVGYCVSYHQGINQSMSAGTKEPVVFNNLRR